MLPRLGTGKRIEGGAGVLAPGSVQTSVQTLAPRELAVGPGGGKLLSQALCLARIELPIAVCAHLQMGICAPLMLKRLGLARALVAIARHGADAGRASARVRAARLELDAVGDLGEAELVTELTSRIGSVDWPAWVPRACMVMHLGSDIAVGMDRLQPAKPPKGVACPLLAARLVSAMRGPVFMRDAAPSLARLLDLFSDTTPAGIFELWLPVRPGSVRPAMPEPAPRTSTARTGVKP
ncbi:MAG: hypothetical protein IPG83_17960 [Novosphingobium sp.]|nr:hypothetical protein [Novosphingobium sp.]